MRRAVLGGVVLVLSSMAAGGEPPAAVTGIATVALADGREVRLAGVELAVPAEDPRVVAIEAVARASARLAPDPPSLDRHGRLRAQLHAGGTWVQGELVGRGLALVAPAADVAPDLLADLLAREAGARAAGRGAWATGEAWPAERVTAQPGRLVLVRGRVRDVARLAEFVYLNFGDDWRRDFTVRLERRRLRALAGAGLDPDALEGREVLVRGVVFEANGPMIELTHPAQIEVLE